MVYVPTPGGATSSRARMLSGELDRCIDEFRQRHPETSGRDVQEALRITASVQAKRTPAVVAGVGLGLALLVGAGLLFFVLGGSAVGRSEVVLILGAIVAVGLLSGVVALSRR